MTDIVAALARLNDRQSAWVEVYTTHTRWQSNVYARMVGSVRSLSDQLDRLLPYIPLSQRDELRAAGLAHIHAVEEMGEALSTLALDHAAGWKNYQDYLLETMSTTDGKGQP